MRPTPRTLDALLARLETTIPTGDERPAAPGYVCLTPAEYERLAAGELPPPGCKVYVGVCPDAWPGP